MKNTFATYTPYKVTAIVSTYAAERFLRACLEDLVAQSIFAQTEVIIIDAHSPQNEEAIAQEFCQKHSNIRYIRTTQREGLYASWNRALRMAQGQYITNANTDDRHAAHAFERMARELDTHPEVALVYANCRITAQENAHFASAPISGHFHWLPYDHINLLRRCEVGPQPMWRRCAHEEVGYFNEKYTVTGDYDMWLRLSERYPLRHIPEELGLYLHYENNLERQEPERTQKEYLEVQSSALRRFMQKDFQPHTPFTAQLAQHKQRLERYLCNLQRGSSIKNQNKLAYHIYAYLLLQAKVQAQHVDMATLSHHLNHMPATASAAYVQELLQAFT